MEVFNIVAGLASIFGFLLTIFVSSKVISISTSLKTKTVNSGTSAINQSGGTGTFTTGKIEIRDASEGYQAKLQSGAIPANQFSKLSDTELRTDALALAKQVRKVGVAFDEAWNSNAITPAELEKGNMAELWERRRTVTGKATAKVVHAYANKHRVDAIQMREELMRRLPSHYNAKADSAFNNPVCSSEFVEIADDLERLAKTLGCAC